LQEAGTPARLEYQPNLLSMRALEPAVTRMMHQKALEYATFTHTNFLERVISFSPGTTPFSITNPTVKLRLEVNPPSENPGSPVTMIFAVIAVIMFLMICLPCYMTPNKHLVQASSHKT